MLHVFRPERGPAGALVLVHPVSGDAEVYRAFAERLAGAGPIVGLDAVGLEPGEAPLGSLRELATRHLATLRGEVAPPWALLGWSVGGVIAAEMARQLAEAGQPVPFLGLLDCRAPVPEMRTRAVDDPTMARFYLESTARTAGREPSRTPASASPAEILEVLRGDGLAHDWDEATVARRFAVFAANARGLFAHDAGRIPVPIHLFESEEEHPKHPRPPTLGWEAHGEVVARARVPGTHFTLMQERYAPRLAAVVGAALASATAA